MTEAEIKKHIGQQLKKLREERKWLQKDVADKLSISQNIICSLELGNTMPGVRTLKRYCDLYGVKSSDILPF